MKYGLFMRGFLHFLFAAICLFYAYPNLYPEQPVVIVEVRKADVAKCFECILESANIKYADIKKSDRKVVFYFNSTDDQLNAKDHLTKNVKTGDVDVTLNLEAQTPAIFSAMGASPMKLGLDLRGGVHFLIEVDTNAMTDMSNEAELKAMKATMIEEKIRYKSFHETPDSDEHIAKVTLTANTDDALSALKKQFRSYDFKVDPEDSLAIMVSKKSISTSQIEESIVSQTIESLNKRVNELGVSEAVIQKQGTPHQRRLAWYSRHRSCKVINRKNSNLQFQIVAPGPAPGTEMKKTRDGRILHLDLYVALTGQSISARANMSDQGPQVQIQLDSDSGARFNRFTRSY